jgi:O-antigen/teichoic acid export membrane protein
VTTSLRVQVSRLRASRLARDAALLFVLNLASRALGFLGSLYAARCLGPVKLGTSGVVQAAAQQAGLLYNGGLDPIGVRRIASDPAHATAVTGAVTRFRIVGAVLLAIGWAGVVLLVDPPGGRAVWLLGIPLLLATALNLTYVFQALERLPLQNAIATGGALLSALAYLLLFRPGAFLGADLVVLGGATAAVAMASWIAYRRVTGHWPLAGGHWALARELLRESWRYWLLTGVVFLYASYQVPFVAYFLGVRAAGWYRAAVTLAAALELLYNSVNSLLLPRLVRWHGVGLAYMWERQRELLRLFLVVGVLVTVAVVLIAPPLLHRLLGPEFGPAIVVFQVLAGARVVAFWGQIFAWGLAASKQDGAYLLASSLGMVCSVPLNLAAVGRWGVLGVAGVSLVSECVVNGACFVLMHRHVARSARAAAPSP